jgi:hypothetical protein
MNFSYDEHGNFIVMDVKERSRAHAMAERQRNEWISHVYMPGLRKLNQFYDDACQHAQRQIQYGHALAVNDLYGVFISYEHARLDMERELLRQYEFSKYVAVDLKQADTSLMNFCSKTIVMLYDETKTTNPTTTNPTTTNPITKPYEPFYPL